MADEIVLEWFRDRVRVLVVSHEHGRWSARIAATLETQEHAEARVPAATAGADLMAWLQREQVGSGKAIVVLPREAVVVRRLQLPLAPPDELPDLVRFQAATKTSSSIDSLALDFLPVQRAASDEGQDVVTLTIDREQLTRMTAVCEAAGLQVERITVSSLTVAQWTRTWSAPDLGLHGPELVVYQQGPRIELSILDQGTLVFSHALQLPEGADADRLRPLKSELTRSLVSLSQARPDVSIDRCYYVSGTADAGVVDLLTQRFPGGLLPVTADAPGGAGYESLFGAVLPEPDDRLHLDLLHPRKRRTVPDRRRWYWAGGGAAAALLLVVSYWMFYSQKASIESEIQSLQSDLANREGQLQKGKPRADAYARVARWYEGTSDPIGLWSLLQRHLPGTDRVYFVELKITPQAGETIARFTGKGQARSRTEIDALNQELSDHGFRVKPTTPALGKRDPDYPWQFDLDVELPRPSAAATSSVARGTP